MSWTGSNTIFGFVKGSAWLTPVAVGAGHKVYITSESLKPDAQLIPSNSLTGTPFPPKGDKGDEFHAGDVNVEVDFDTVHRLMAFAMGTAGVPSSVGAGTWQHNLRMANSLEGLFSTAVVADSSTFVREYPSVKHNGFSMEVTHNQRLTGKFPLVPGGLNINTTSGTNELTTLPTIALPTGADTAYATFNQLEVLLNAAGGGALASPTDDLYVTKVSLTVPGSIKTDDVTTQYAPYIDEPLRDSDVVVTGTLEFSKLQDTNMIVELLSKDVLKMRWTFTGPIADGSEAYMLQFFFSNVQIESGDFNVGGKGYVPKNVNFRASTPTAAHTGFAFADAFYAVVVNQQSADPLA